jgi:hypothetical protein
VCAFGEEVVHKGPSADRIELFRAEQALKPGCVTGGGMTPMIAIRHAKKVGLAPT